MGARADLPVVVGLSGATGAAIALALVRALQDDGVPTAIVLTAAGAEVLREECGAAPEALLGPRTRLYDERDLSAPWASGSRPTRGMAIVPCSANTLAKIAHGFADNLLTRAAHVHLKERRRLVLVPRETPLSPIYAENLLAVLRAGASVVDPAPAFYLKPASVQEIVRYIAGKVLEQLGLSHQLYRGWKAEEPGP